MILTDIAKAMWFTVCGNDRFCVTIKNVHWKNDDDVTFVGVCAKQTRFFICRNEIVGMGISVYSGGINDVCVPVCVCVASLQGEPAGRLSAGLLRGHVHAVRVHQPGVAPGTDRPRRRPPLVGAAPGAAGQRSRAGQ